MKVNATTTGYVTGTWSVFHTDYGFFAGAAIVQLICICLVAPTYWNWREIGQIVSFSPLEIAKVRLASSHFCTPGMALGHGNVGIRSTGAWEHELQLHWPPNREGSDDELRYGRINVDGGRTKLAFGRPDSVRWPENGCLVDVYDLWNT